MKESPGQRLQRARAAQLRWIALPYRQRKSHMKRLRHVLMEHAEQILATVHEELGKPELDTLAGDVMVTLEQMLYYEKYAERLLRPRSVAGSPVFFRGTKTREMYEPHGVVLVIAPWNYPVQLSLIQLITALYAGNAVVCKCSEYAPQTAALLQQIVWRAGLPEDLVQFSWGGSEEGAALLDAMPDYVFFTGSSKVGRKVAERAGQLLIPSTMELGGKDAAVVFASCNLERTVNGLVYGAFSNSGQVCVSAKRIYVEAPIFERFFDEFEKCTRALQPHRDFGPLKVEPIRQILDAQIVDAMKRNATVYNVGVEEASIHIVKEAPSDVSLLQEESFGPVTCIASFHNEAEAISLANSSDFGLSASVWTSDMKQAERFIRAVRAGSCVVNDILRNVSHPGAAFGGVGASGYGRYHGPEGLRTMSRIKTVMIATGNDSHQINWFPFTETTTQRLMALLRFRHGGTGFGKRLVEIIRRMRGTIA